MSVRKRPDSDGWLVYIKVKGRPRFRRTVAGSLTKRQALNLERDWREDLEAGRIPRDLPDADRRPDLIATWGELRKMWWGQHGKHLGSSDRAEDHLDRISAAIGDDKLLAELCTADFAAAVQRWRVEIPVLISKRGKRRVLKPNGPTTINTRLRHAATVLGYATKVLAGRCVRPPEIAWKVLRLEEPDRNPLEMLIPPAVRDAVADVAPPHVRRAIRLAEATGQRVSSVLALRWEHVDRDQGLIALPVKSRKPGGRILVLPLTPEVELVLQEVAGADDWPARGWVIRWRGERVKSIKKAVRTARAKAGAHGFLMKNVRHSTALEIIAATGSIAKAGAALGHADTGVTEKHYGRVDVQQVREALEQRAERLRSAKSGPSRAPGPRG